MAAVFPEIAVKREDGRYDAHFIDIDGKVTIEIVTKDQLVKAHLFSIERFGYAPITRIIN